MYREPGKVRAGSEEVSEDGSGVACLNRLGAKHLKDKGMTGIACYSDNEAVVEV